MYSIIFLTQNVWLNGLGMAVLCAVFVGHSKCMVAISENMTEDVCSY